MPDFVEVCAPQANVNDDSLTVIELCVVEGSYVEVDTVLMIAETSKAAIEICAPVSGYVHFWVELNQEVSVGSPLCIIAADQNALSRYAPQDSGIAGHQAVEKPAPVPQNMQSAVGVSYIGVSAEQVRGESVALCQWLAPDESRVSVGQGLCRILDTSRTTIQVNSPVAGFVKFQGVPGDVFPVPAQICTVGDSLDLIRGGLLQAGEPVMDVCKVDRSSIIRQYDPNQYTKTPRTAHNGSARFSHNAKKLMDRYALTESAFPLRGLVRSADVMAHLAPMSPAGPEIPPKSGPATPAAVRPQADSNANIVSDVATHEVKLSRAKRIEVRLLASSQASTVTSQVSLLVPTRGIFAACLQNPSFSGQMSSRIIFEVSRLLKKYPIFNAGYRSGHVVYYDDVNIGYAMDVDRGLKVPVFLAADKLSLQTIHQQKQAYIEKYLLNKLELEDLARGTFTITDLAEQGAWLFNPIINKGQAAILGIGGEQDMGRKQAYPLILAYDHRLTEGLLATKFLAELKERLMAHEDLLRHQMVIEKPIQGESSQEPYCQSCFRRLSEISANQNYLFKCIGDNGKDRMICSVCAGGW